MTDLARKPEDFQAVFDAIRNGESVSDSDFDQVYPSEIRALSECHWTPISVARRAAELLVQDSGTRVLDIGSGCGKFCLVGRLTTVGQFYGIEQRKRLAVCAHIVAARYGLDDRIRFLSGDLAALDWSPFTAFYLYNPFVENLYPSEIRIDEEVELNEKRFIEVVRAVQMRLHLRPVGTRVVTYHGFGGEMPPGYELTLREPRGGDFLQLWEKTREG